MFGFSLGLEVLIALVMDFIKCDNSKLPVLSEIHWSPWGEKRENPDDEPSIGELSAFPFEADISSIYLRS